MILDAPVCDPYEKLIYRVGLLSRLGPLITLVPGGVDVAPLLDAGADNVLVRDMPVRELAVRLAVGERWLKTARRSASQRWDSGTSALPQQGSQRLLLRLLLGTSGPWCCHDLCHLLGTPSAPLSRAGLRGRMDRLDSRLALLGVRLRRTGNWGRITYEAVPVKPLR